MCPAESDAPAHVCLAVTQHVLCASLLYMLSVRRGLKAPCEQLFSANRMLAVYFQIPFGKGSKKKKQLICTFKRKQRNVFGLDTSISYISVCLYGHRTAQLHWNAEVGCWIEAQRPSVEVWHKMKNQKAKPPEEGRHSGQSVWGICFCGCLGGSWVAQGSQKGLGRVQGWGGSWSIPPWREVGNAVLKWKMVWSRYAGVVWLRFHVSALLLLGNWSTDSVWRRTFQRHGEAPQQHRGANPWEPCLDSGLSTLDCSPGFRKQGSHLRGGMLFVFLYWKIIFLLLLCTEHCSNGTVYAEKKNIKDLGQRKAICYLTLVFLVSQVIFPNNFEANNGGSGLGHLPMMPISPIVHPRVKEVRTDLGGSLRRGTFRVPHICWMCDFIYSVLVPVDQEVQMHPVKPLCLLLAAVIGHHASCVKRSRTCLCVGAGLPDL